MCKIFNNVFNVTTYTIMKCSGLIERFCCYIPGPMKLPEGVLNPDEKNVDSSNLPISLQKYYKNSRWWPTEAAPGKSYQQARTQELACNFKDQLNTIWDVSVLKLSLFIYTYENVCLSVCLFVHLYLGYFETDLNTL